MQREVKKNEFLSYLGWLFLGLSGEHVLKITNLDREEVELFTWTAVVNDREKMDLILDKIKMMINMEIILETHGNHGILRRRCFYRDGIITNESFGDEVDKSITDIDLAVNWDDECENEELGDEK